MIKITSAEFLQGVADLHQLPKNELKEDAGFGNLGERAFERGPERGQFCQELALESGVEAGARRHEVCMP